MSKRKSRQRDRRLARRALNKALDFFKQVSNGKLMRSRYGDGLRASDIKDSSRDETD